MTGVSHPLDRFSPASGSVSDVAAALRAAGYRVCSLEDLDRRSEDAPPPTGETLEDVLDTLVAADPEYRWQSSEADLIEISPLESVLDEPAAASDRPTLVDELERHGIAFFDGLAGTEPTLDLPETATTVRALLNALVVATGSSAAWHISGTAGAWFLTIVGVERRSQ